eukprot:351762-Chlamydomonas_euryale.AAC.9
MLELSLAQWGATLWNDKHTRLAWGADVVAFLADRVDFDGPFPLEGGKQVREERQRPAKSSLFI